MFAINATAAPGLAMPGELIYIRNFIYIVFFFSLYDRVRTRSGVFMNQKTFCRSRTGMVKKKKKESNSREKHTQKKQKKKRVILFTATADGGLSARNSSVYIQ